MRRNLVILEEKVYKIMNEHINTQDSKSQWFAIKTRQDFKAEVEYSKICDDILFPKEAIRVSDEKVRYKAIIPHVLFIKTTRAKALELEKKGREHPEQSIPFWIYRYPNDDQIQPISQSSIHLIHLLTAEDSTKCQIFNKADFKDNQYVRITGGYFEGYKGYVVRVKKNKHVIVRIEGICMVILPFIHPDFLSPIN